MEFIRVFILILLAAFTGNKLCAQNKTDSSVNLLKSLVTEDNEHYSVSDSNIIYVIVTEKNCSKCFGEFCESVGQSVYKNYKVQTIGITKYNLLNLLPLSARYKEVIPCANETLFHFTDSKQFPNIYDTPSPQLIIERQGKIQYLPYSEAMNFIHTMKKQ